MKEEKVTYPYSKQEEEMFKTVDKVFEFWDLYHAIFYEALFQALCEVDDTDYDMYNRKKFYDEVCIDGSINLVVGNENRMISLKKVIDSHEDYRVKSITLEMSDNDHGSNCELSFPDLKEKG